MLEKFVLVAQHEALYGRQFPRGVDGLHLGKLWVRRHRRELVDVTLHLGLVLLDELVDVLHVGLLPAKLDEVCEVLQALGHKSERALCVFGGVVAHHVEQLGIENGRAEEPEENEAAHCRILGNVLAPLVDDRRLKVGEDIPQLHRALLDRCLDGVPNALKVPKEALQVLLHIAALDARRVHLARFLRLEEFLDVLSDRLVKVRQARELHVLIHRLGRKGIATENRVRVLCGHDLHLVQLAQEFDGAAVRLEDFEERARDLVPLLAHRADGLDGSEIGRREERLQLAVLAERQNKLVGELGLEANRTHLRFVVVDRHEGIPVLVLLAIGEFRHIHDAVRHVRVLLELVLVDHNHVELFERLCQVLKLELLAPHGVLPRHDLRARLSHVVEAYNAVGVRQPRREFLRFSHRKKQTLEHENRVVAANRVRRLSLRSAAVATENLHPRHLVLVRIGTQVVNLLLQALVDDLERVRAAKERLVHVGHNA
eukprot:Opistho-1_new@72105